MTTNPFSHHLIERIRNAQMQITGKHIDGPDLWILLDEIEQHLQRLDDVQGQTIRALEMAVNDKLKVSTTSAGIDPATYQINVKYVSGLDG